MRCLDSTLVFEGYYAMYEDSTDNSNNFVIAKSELSYLSETEYYSPKICKSKKTLSYYEKHNHRDTSMLEIINFAETGAVTHHIIFRKERVEDTDQKSGAEKKAMLQWTIIEDKLQNTSDTIIPPKRILEE